MSWVFNFSPYGFTPPQTQPYFLFNLPCTMNSIQIDQEPIQNVIEPQRQGIQINLTAVQLQAAGYQNNKKAWSQEEDDLLMNLFKKNDLSWKQIAQRIPGRTSKMCYSRYRRIESRSKEQWTRTQDAKLRNLVGLWETDWQKISEYFPRRTLKQVQDHYMNYLRPEINKQPWTLQQDLLLIKLLRQYGKDWAQIQKRLNGRTQNQIKNRYFGRLKRLEDRKKQIEGGEQSDKKN